MNVIEGANEAGKSTIFAFIFAMLFGLDGSEYALELKKKYEPWDDKGGYGGAMVFESEGRSYLIERSFLADAPYLHLTEVESGRELVPAADRLRQLTGYITESVYSNTVSIGQMRGISVEELASELKEHVNNIGRGKNINISIQSTQDELAKRRISLQKRQRNDIDAAVKELTAAKEGIEKELETNLTRYVEKVRQLRTGRSEEYERFSDREEKAKERKNLAASLEEDEKRLKEELARYSQQKDELVKQAGGVKNSSSALGALQIVCIALAAAFITAIPLSVYLHYTARLRWRFVAVIGVMCVIGACAMAVLFAVSGRRRRQRINFFRLAQDRASKYEETERELNAIARKKSEIIKALSETDNDEYHVLHEQNTELEKEIQRLSWEQQGITARLDSTNEKLEIARRDREENDRINRDIAAVRTAMQMLFLAARQIEDSFGFEMLGRASDYFAAVTGGRYSKMIIGDDKRVRLVGERTVDLLQVSRGTIEQAYLCIRMAAADCFTQMKLPFILDDTFAFFDDDRTAGAMELLGSCNRQVIILTCQKREKRILADRGFSKNRQAEQQPLKR